MKITAKEMFKAFKGESNGKQNKRNSHEDRD